MARKKTREDIILDLARDQYLSDEISFDAPNNEPMTHIISEGEGNGCYIKGWVWVSFSGTVLDKEPDATNESRESR